MERDFLLRLLELGHTNDLKPFLEGALALIAGATFAKKGYVALHAGDALREPHFWIAHGLAGAELDEVRRAISTGIVAEAIATGRTISTANAGDDPRFRDQQSVQLQRIKAVLCAPIGNPIIGVLYLEGRDRLGPFPEQDRALLELFARHLAPLADRLLSREEAAAGTDHTLALRDKLSVSQIAGKSAAIAQVFRDISVAAPVPVSVLITGESGTGKTALARALHDSSPRSRGPFVELNCAAIPETLFESELFGAEKGAHSTALKRMEGKIDAARGGTLFLDEVSEMPLIVQPKLLTFLQSRRYYRLGSTQPLEADVRIVAATNADLQTKVREKVFREDLYFRLNVLQVRVPPLRDRREDIGAIADAIVAALGRVHSAEITLSHSAKIALAEGAWPGNVRELENALARGWAVALSQNARVIEPHHLFPERASESAEAETYESALRRFQRTFLAEALTKNGWNVSQTARTVGLARSHLNDLIKAFGLVRGG
ncbi:MAG: sigma-54-dependent Fis family transcriptional regulator [Polyangiaceae bacterium]|nr:sigma-54-dependent Fis family transcriptional regulator [Polyangiaceae bacterium]